MSPMPADVRSPPTARLTPLGVLGFIRATRRALPGRAAQPGLLGAGAGGARRLAGLPRSCASSWPGSSAPGMVEVRGDTVRGPAAAEALARLIAEETRRMQSRGEQLDAVRGLLPVAERRPPAPRRPEGRGGDRRGARGRRRRRSWSAACPRRRRATCSGCGRTRGGSPPGSEIDEWVSGLIRGRPAVPGDLPGRRAAGRARADPAARRGRRARADPGRGADAGWRSWAAPRR